MKYQNTLFPEMGCLLLKISGSPNNKNQPEILLAFLLFMSKKYK